MSDLICTNIHTFSSTHFLQNTKHTLHHFALHYTHHSKLKACVRYLQKLHTQFGIPCTQNALVKTHGNSQITQKSLVSLMWRHGRVACTTHDDTCPDVCPERKSLVMLKRCCGQRHIRDNMSSHCNTVCCILFVFMSSLVFSV